MEDYAKEQRQNYIRSIRRKHRYGEHYKAVLAVIAYAVVVGGIVIALTAQASTITYTAPVQIEQEAPKEEAYTIITAHVTGYNTVPEQTDNRPCEAASGDNICGRTDVVACPREYQLGTEVEIDGKSYVCLDRTAIKFNGRWDISCDKDTKCPYLVSGVKEIVIKK